MTDVRHEDVTAATLAKVVVAVCALLVVVKVSAALASLAAQFVVASFVAIALDTAVRWMQRRGLGRGRAVLVVLLGVLVATLMAALIVIGPLVDGARALAEEGPAIVSELEDLSVVDATADALQVDQGEVLEAVRHQLTQLPSALVDWLTSFVGGIFGLVNFVLMIIFLLTGGEAMLRYAQRIWPRLAGGAPWVIVVGAYRSIGEYLLGATAQALLAAASLAAVLTILGTPYALPLALLMFLLDYVPLVGATLASIPAVAITLVSEGTGPALVMTLFLIVYQQVENAIIQPRIQGRAVNLPVTAIFFSVMVGGQLFGVAGALLAVPTASVVSIAIEQWLEWRRRSGSLGRAKESVAT